MERSDVNGACELEATEDPDLEGTTTIFDVLRIDICCRAILEKIPFPDLVRSERVSREWQAIVHDYLRNNKRNMRFFDLYRDIHRYNQRDKIYKNNPLIMDHTVVIRRHNSSEIIKKPIHLIIKEVTDRWLT